MEVVSVPTKELDELRKDFEKHREEESVRWGEMLNAQQESTAAVQELTKSTEGVVTLYNDLQGAARVGISLQKFVVWCSKWGALGAIAAGALSYLVENHS